MSTPAQAAPPRRTFWKITEFFCAALSCLMITASPSRTPMLPRVFDGAFYPRGSLQRGFAGVKVKSDTDF
jgi:hypothetical protein